MKKNDKITIIFYVFLVISFSVAMFYINSTFDTTSSLPNIIPELITELEVVKEVDIEKEIIYRVMTDVENYHKVLPRNIQSSNIIERSDNVFLVEYEVFEAGINTKLLVQHKMYPYNEHIMEIIDGDAKGTKITQKFSNKDSVTTINTVIEFELEGILSTIGFLPKGNLEHAANTILTSFIDYSQISDDPTKQTIDDLYREILLRPADTEALEYWGSMLKTGDMTIDEIRTEILNSDEKKSLLILQEMKTVDELSNKTKQTIDDLYREILVRSADTEALEYWGSMLESEIITEQELRKNILKSDEALSLKLFNAETSHIIHDIFNEVLERDPSKSEASHYKYLINIEEITEEEIRSELKQFKENEED